MTEKQHITAVHTVENLIQSGWELGASDIHFEPFEEELKVRFRIDGTLRAAYIINKKIADEVVSYVKVTASMRTDEHSLPQDNRFVFMNPKKESIHIRVSVMPTQFGEKIVLRLLSNAIDATNLSALGLSLNIENAVRRSLQHSSGMIIVTGPTGSGKTTTLYHLMESIKRKDTLSITTLEDPVEYAVPGVTQIPINETKGFGFDKGLRSLLRQDPDVIMVGEIRDRETARLGIQAALTGHLVMTTLHTTDTLTTIPRLIDMGVEPYLIAAAVKMIISQRLVRMICPKCTTDEPMLDSSWQMVRQSFPDVKMQKPSTTKRGQGCKSCQNSGYKGRIGVYELLEISEKISTAALKRKTPHLMKRIATKEGMIELGADCWDKVVNGITTIEEFMRISNE